MSIRYSSTKFAGRICWYFEIKDYEFSVHFVVSKDCWVWGYEKDWYDGPIWDIGLGPLFVVSITRYGLSRFRKKELNDKEKSNG